MTDEEKKVAAEKVYADLCNALDNRNWHYQKHEEDLVITFDVSGDDIPMSFVFAVDAGRQLLRVFSKLPFTVPEDKRVDLAIATCAATNEILDGSFDYNITKGEIVFRLTTSFRESSIGDELFNYMVDISSYTVDEYNDKFLMIGKGVLSVNDFISSL